MEWRVAETIAGYVEETVAQVGEMDPTLVALVLQVPALFH
jgi:hypothetical protein